MEPKARYVFVGVALLVLISATVFFGFWLFGSVQREKTKMYTMIFRNVSMGGVTSDSNVTFHGIKVGKINSVQIPKNDIESVRLTAEIQESIPVKIDTKAVVSSSILTGVAVVDLIGGTQQSDELTIISANEKYPIIKQGETELQAWTKDLPETLNKVNDVAKKITVLTDDLDKFLNPKNQELVSEILTNVKTLTSDLSGKNGMLLTIFDQVGEVIKKLRGTIEDLNNPNSPNGKALIGISDTFRQEAINISRDVSRITNRIEAVSETLENPSSALFGPNKKAYGPGEKSQ